MRVVSVVRVVPGARRCGGRVVDAVVVPDGELGLEQVPSFVVPAPLLDPLLGGQLEELVVAAGQRRATWVRSDVAGAAAVATGAAMVVRALDPERDARLIDLASRRAASRNADSTAVLMRFQTVARVSTRLSQSRQIATSEVSDRNSQNSTCGTSTLNGLAALPPPVTCQAVSLPLSTFQSALT